MFSTDIKPHSLFHPAPALLGYDVWKVTSPWAISFSMYSSMFEERFPRSISHSKRELEMTSDYQDMVLRLHMKRSVSLDGGGLTPRWDVLDLSLSLGSLFADKGWTLPCVVLFSRVHLSRNSLLWDWQGYEVAVAERERSFSQFIRKLRSCCACLAWDLQQ